MESQICNLFPMNKLCRYLRHDVFKRDIDVSGTITTITFTENVIFSTYVNPLYII